MKEKPVVPQKLPSDYEVKFNQKTIDTLVKSLKNGDGRVRAVKKAGIDYQTFLNWMKDERRVEFIEQIKNAENYNLERQKGKCLSNIEAAGEKSWFASAWLLERRFPEEFAANRIKDDKEPEPELKIHIVIEKENA